MKRFLTRKFAIATIVVSGVALALCQVISFYILLKVYGCVGAIGNVSCPALHTYAHVATAARIITWLSLVGLVGGSILLSQRPKQQ